MGRPRLELGTPLVAISFSLDGNQVLSCIGDCNTDGTINIDELITLVNIALGNANLSSCTVGDANQDKQITVDEILTAVINTLNGCQAT